MGPFSSGAIELPDVIAASVVIIIGVLLTRMGRSARELGMLYYIGLLMIVAVVGSVATDIMPTGAV